MERKNNPYDVIDSNKYEIGRVTVVQEHFLIDGRIYPYTYVNHRDGVCIIPIYNDQVVIIDQYRHALDQWLLEFPAGAVDDGETSLEAAKRELLEETGFLADEWMYMGNYYMNEGISSAKCDLYFARCSKREEVRPDQTEQIKTMLVSFKEFEMMIEKNEFKLLIGLVGWMQAKKRNYVQGIE